MSKISDTAGNRENNAHIRFKVDYDHCLDFELLKFLRVLLEYICRAYLATLLLLQPPVLSPVWLISER